MNETVGAHSEPVFTLLALLSLEPPRTPAMPTPTTVELRVTSVDEGDAKLLEQSLQRQLGDRLLEDGHRVVPVGRAAGVRVWIHLDAEGATIDLQGATHRVETVAGGDREVVALEIQQLTSALIDEVEPSAAEPTPAVAIETSGSSIDPELRERLQTGLLERGFALTREPSGDDRRLCVVSSASGEAELSVVAGSQTCAVAGDAVRVTPGATLELGRELLLDHASASLDAWTATSEREPEPKPELEPKVELPRASDLPEPEPIEPSMAKDVPRRSSVTPTLRAGLLARTDGPDALLSAGVRVGLRRGIGASLDLSVVPSKAPGLQVIETLPSAAIDGRVGLGEQGLIALGVFGGVHLHSYVQAGPTGRRATLLGPSVGATVHLAWLARRGALLLGGLRAGWSGGRWVHLHDGATSWRRSMLMIGIELGVGWDFAWGRRR
ncbi:hypothetical protein ACNOYE_34095 [Nannocystaceae bacterium ST9]